MFNTVSKIRPELKDDLQFQLGLKIIKNVQIGLILFTVLFFVVYLMTTGAPIDLKLIYSFSFRILLIVSLGTAIKLFIYPVLLITIIGAVGSIAFYSLYFSQLTSLGITVSGLEIALMLSLIISTFYVLVQKDTKYVIEVSNRTFKEIQAKSKNKKKKETKE